ncbi:MAG: DUF4870 domain-containing protein [Euryarchaeota archaeon]|nr:DUF4870 domain-containing protein [Euryarchaeota archaeon]
MQQAPPFAPMPPPSAQPPPPGWGPIPVRDTTLGVLAYVLTFVAGWLAPLVIFLVAKKEDKINRFHAMQALLLSIAQFILFFPLMMLWFFPLFGLPTFGGDVSPAGLGAMIGVFMAFMAAACGLGVLFLVLNIVGAVKASRAEMWKLPLIGAMAERWS